MRIDDLADSELRRRLVQRGVPVQVANYWIRYREYPAYAKQIEKVIDR